MNIKVDLQAMFPIALNIDTGVIDQLRWLWKDPGGIALPHDTTAAARQRGSDLVNELLLRLMDAVARNPRKSWALEQFVPTLQAASREDTEVRELVGTYLERVMDILGIESSDGLLTMYLTFGGMPDP